MNEILFRAHGRKACVAFCGDLTSGSVGLPIKFEFDSAWDGLQKTAIFKGSGTTVDVVLTGDTAAVPAEVMEDSGLSLKVGVWGADPDGNVVIPTVWVEVGKIKPGAEPSGIDPHPPAPSWAAQVQQIATEALTNSEEAVATANATEARMTALEQEIAGDVEQAGEYARQAQEAAGSAGEDAQTAAAAAQTAGSAASTASAAAATATEKAADTARDAAAAQEAASEAETAKDAAETAAASIAASAAQIEQNRQDIADLDTEVSQQKSAIEALDSLVNRKAGMLVDTASGAIASFVPDSTIPNLLGVGVDIEPVQDLHGYDSPWPAGGGANQFDQDTVLPSIGFVKDGDAWFIQTSSTVRDRIVWENTSEISGSVSLIYTYKYSNTLSQGVRFKFEYKDGSSADNYASGVDGYKTLSFTSNASKTLARIRATYGTGSVSTWIKDMQVNFGTNMPYSPYSNICPISGWDAVEVERTGVNLLAPTEYGVIGYAMSVGGNLKGPYNCPITQITDGYSVSIPTSWTGAVFATGMLPPGTYHVHFKTNDSNARFSVYKTSENLIVESNELNVASATTTDKNVTLTKPGRIAVFCGKGSTGTIDALELQVEVGSAYSSYARYSAQTYPIIFPTEAGTVYGGTLDVSNGGAEPSLAAIDLGTATWLQNGDDGHVFQMTPYNTVDSSVPMLCSIFKPVKRFGQTVAAIQDNEIAITNSAAYTVVRVRSNASNTLQDFLTLCAGQKLVYKPKVSLPIIQTEPTQIATIANQPNNVWADGGDVSVEFAADLKAYIDQKIAAAVAALS